MDGLSNKMQTGDKGKLLSKALLALAGLHTIGAYRSGVASHLKKLPICPRGPPVTLPWLTPRAPDTRRPVMLAVGERKVATKYPFE